MSGICGAWSFDGDNPDLNPILALLKRRGPDGTHSWSEGPVALGHTLLATTPEALVEQLPYTYNGCTITADVRLDNREVLIATLKLCDETRTIGDGELILRAYLEWGEDCPTHLLGDFAFAVWDQRAARLFCARDHMGMRQLIYHHAPARGFAFATEVRALVAHSAVPKRVNDGRVADFLDDLEGIDLTSTFFQEVFRLPPAHSLTVSAQGSSLRRYWELRTEPELTLDGDQAYVDAFLTIFEEAVRCRLRSTGSVGAMLSGGIDSNSVAVIAGKVLVEEGRELLLTFSAVGPDRNSCVETNAIEEARHNVCFRSQVICYNDLGFQFPELEHLTKDMGEPFDQHMTLHRSIHIKAKQAGVSILLDGAAGDIVFSTDNRIASHLERFHFCRAWQEARGEERFWKVPRLSYHSFAAATWRSFVPRLIRQQKRRLETWLLSLSPETIVSSSLARSISLHDRRKTFRSHLGDDKASLAEQRAKTISHPHLTVGRERYDRVAGQFAIEPRDPFMDIRVIRFCLSLPENQLQRYGWPKWLLRQAMNGWVPNSVIWRPGKEHLGWYFTDRLVKNWFLPATKSISNMQIIETYVKKRVVADLERECGNLSDRSKKALFLGLFLQSNGLEDEPMDSGKVVIL